MLLYNINYNKNIVLPKRCLTLIITPQDSSYALRLNLSMQLQFVAGNSTY